MNYKSFEDQKTQYHDGYIRMGYKDAFAIYSMIQSSINAMRSAFREITLDGGQQDLHDFEIFGDRACVFNRLEEAVKEYAKDIDFNGFSSEELREEVYEGLIFKDNY